MKDVLKPLSIVASMVFAWVQNTQVHARQTPSQDDSDDEEWEEGFLEAHEELWPLKEALERAIMRKTEAIAQKEALEAKVVFKRPPSATLCASAHTAV